MPTPSFRQFSAAEFFGTSPLTIGAVTATAGDTLIGIGICGSGQNDPVTPSTVPDGNFPAVTGLSLTSNDTNNGNTFSPGLLLSAAGGSISPRYTQAVGNLFGFFYEYFNVLSVSDAAFILRATPGTTIGGNPVTVPVGSVLFAMCVDAAGGTVVPSAQANGGVTPSTRESGNPSGTTLPFCTCDYVGTGGSITPTWTASDGATENFVIIQFTLNGSTGAVYNVSTSETANPTDTTDATDFGPALRVAEYGFPDDTLSTTGWIFISAGAVATGANPTPAVPAGYAAGDLLILVATSGTAYSTTPPTGYGGAWLAQRTTASPMLTVGMKVATGSESAPTLTNSATTSSAVLLCYRSTRQVTDVVGTIATGTSSSPATSSQTTTKTNDLLLEIYGSASGTARTWSAQNAACSRRASFAPSTTICGLCVNDESKATAGATTARTQSLSGSATWNAVAISIQATVQSDASLSESAFPSDSSSVTGTWNAAEAESASPVDTLSATGTWNVAETESATATDTAAIGGNTYSLSQAEAATVLDTLDATVTSLFFRAAKALPGWGPSPLIPRPATALIAISNWFLSVFESLTPSDSSSVSITTSQSTAEAAAPADSTNASNVTAASFSESGSPVDLSTVAGNVYALSELESGSPVDTESALRTVADTVSEVASLTDTQSAQMTAAIATAETGTPSDTNSALRTTVGSTSESGSPVESTSAANTSSQTTAESASPADTSIAILTSFGSLSEAIIVSDTITGSTQNTYDVSEHGTLSDTESGLLSASMSISESVSLADAISGVSQFLSSLSEAGALLDSLSATAVEAVALGELGNLSELLSVVQQLQADLAEVIVLLDTVALSQLAFIYGNPFNARVAESRPAVSNTLATKTYIKAKDQDR